MSTHIKLYICVLVKYLHLCPHTDDYEDELQMAAATWDDASQVRILTFSLSFVIVNANFKCCHHHRRCVMIVKIAFQVRVAPPQNFVAPHPEGEESKDQVVYDHHSQF